MKQTCDKQYNSAMKQLKDSLMSALSKNGSLQLHSFAFYRYTYANECVCMLSILSLHNKIEIFIVSVACKDGQEHFKTSAVMQL